MVKVDGNAANGGAGVVNMGRSTRRQGRGENDRGVYIDRVNTGRAW
jgi:hypothetical protein